MDFKTVLVLTLITTLCKYNCLIFTFVKKPYQRDFRTFYGSSMVTPQSKQVVVSYMQKTNFLTVSFIHTHFCSYTLLLCLWIEERTWNKLMYLVRTRINVFPLFVNLYLLFFFIVHCTTNNKKWRKNRVWNYALNVNKIFKKSLYELSHHILDYCIKKNFVSKNYFLYKQ